jgi:hypothetical protein
MIQRGNRLRLALEALAELSCGDFDRSVALQPGIVGAIDFAHAAFPDENNNLVGTECFARGKGRLNESAKFNPSGRDSA